MILPDEVVLTDDAGTDLGSVPRALVHTEATPLHRAFSVYLIDPQGRTLLTRRSLSKRAWPGVWSNSCCGHPRPGESTVDAIVRRVGEELGVHAHDVACVLPDFRYRAVDPSGVVENEICPVYVGFVDAEPQPDPAEVMDFTWVPWSQAHASLTASPDVFSPWMALQVPLLGADLDRRVTARLQAAGEQAPRWEQTTQRVESILSEQATWLSRRWLATGLAPEDDPVLEHDLPSWLMSLVSHVGKRIRPQMCHWGFVAAGGSGGTPAYDQVCRVAAATELLHTFALIHDDVMDESPWRRGQPAAQVQACAQHERGGFAGDSHRFGDNIAILLGDLAHMQADHVVSGLPESLREQWFELCAELIAGQGADLTAAAGDSRSYEQAERIARLKSGAYTIERPLLLGACAAGAGPEQREALSHYGRALGEAFALRDDILGVWGDPRVTGKPGGDDLLARKPTVLWMAASERLDPAGLRVLDRVGTPGAAPDDVATLQQTMLRAGIGAWAEDRVRSLVERATQGVDSGVLTPSGVEGLRRAAESVAWRDA